MSSGHQPAQEQTEAQAWLLLHTMPSVSFPEDRESHGPVLYLPWPFFSLPVETELMPFNASY